jgi:hypothetical protein
MRANIATAAFLILCVFVLGFMLNSCAAVGSVDHFGYTSGGFDAKIDGRIDGEEVSVIFKSRHADGEGNNVTLIWETPSAIDGLVLSRKTTGEYEARLGELVLHDFNAEGLLEPFLPLLYSGDITSIRKNRDGRTIILVKEGELDLEYVFSEKTDHPHSIKGRVGERNIELYVKSLEFV